MLEKKRQKRRILNQNKTLYKSNKKREEKNNLFAL